MKFSYVYAAVFAGRKKDIAYHFGIRLSGVIVSWGMYLS